MSSGLRRRLPTMKTKNLAELYHLAPVDWDAASASLPEVQPRTLTAARAGTPPGSPRSMPTAARTSPVSGHDGTTARTESCPAVPHARAETRDPRCAVSLSTKGYDVVVEGTAELVTDPDLVSAAAERFAAGGWPCVVDESGTALTDP